jgi:hypothetical protein
MRALFGPQLRLQDVMMADAFRIAGGGGLDVHGVQHLVKQHALIPPHTRRSWNGVAFQSWLTLTMPAR